MAATLKNSALKSLIIIILLTFLCVAGAFTFFNFSPNIKNIMVQGYVYDKATDQPVNNCRIVIFSRKLKEHNTAGTDETLYLKTNKDGYYRTTIDKSYLIFIRAYKPEYKIIRSGAVIAKKDIEQNFILEKGPSSESEFIKPGESSVIIE